MSDFKKGDLVIPADDNYSKCVGVVVRVERQEDGRTHQVLWVDPDGCFEAWHYENGIKFHEENYIINQSEGL